MPIRINSFGGKLVWELRKRHSAVVTSIAYKTCELLYRGKIRKYIAEWDNKERIPMFSQIMLETINRCNGHCAFCPANVNDEKRPFKLMSEELLNKIAEELKKINFNGNIYLNVNNEPFIDVRILDIATMLRKTIPNAKIKMITNGTLLSVDKMKDIAKCIDELVINNYSYEYELADNLQEIYRYVKSHEKEFAKTDIVIARRYVEEVLATRAGAAPNKPRKTMKLNSPCIYPFTDLVIFPDGEVGLCCNDCFENTHMGNVNNESLIDVWNCQKYKVVRESMKKGREAFPFCKECDVIDAGSREKLIKEKLSL